MKKFAVGDGERIIRIENKTGKPTWFKLEPVTLPNGDTVDVGARRQEPDAAETLTDAQRVQFKTLIEGGLYSRDPRAPRWVGFAIAKVLVIDLSADNPQAKRDRAKITKIIETVSPERERKKRAAGKRGGADAAGGRAAPKRSTPRTAV